MVGSEYRLLLQRLDLSAAECVVEVKGKTQWTPGDGRAERSEPVRGGDSQPRARRASDARQYAGLSVLIESMHLLY